MQKTIERCRWLLAVPFMIFCPLPAWSAQTNAWTNPASAHWESPNWSLGTLPDSTQSVAITNTGFKAVGIFPSTVTSASNSLTVGNLTIDGPTNGLNTVLLNFSGTAVPLHVLGDALIGTNGAVANFYSGFQVDGNVGGAFTIQRGNFIEEGGTLVATNVITSVVGGSMHLTNALATFGPLILDSSGVFGDTNLGTIVQSGGQVTANLSMRAGDYELIGGNLNGVCSLVSLAGNFNQSGGTNFAGINVGESSFLIASGSAIYTFKNGTIITPFIDLGSVVLSFGVFAQANGTVHAGSLTVGGASGDFPGAGLYSLTNGSVFAGLLTLVNGGIQQSGGQITTTNDFVAVGNPERLSPRFVTYTLSGGNLTCPAIEFSFGTFTQSGGTNNVARSLAIADATYTLSGGTLLTSNTSVMFGNFVDRGGVRAVTRFLQTGGQHQVMGTLSNSDEYILAGGSLSANKIILQGTLIISNGTAFTNPGLFSFQRGNLLIEGAATEHLGPVSLFDDSTIDLESGSHTLTFADSTGLFWAFPTTLVITNWNGSTNGGGSDQVIFGTNANGLLPSQLDRIQFANPAGFPPGYQPARILATGEVVPGRQLLLFSSQAQNKLVVNWTGTWVLQTSTKPDGPFFDVFGATSPYTNTDTTSPARFFRLRF